MRFSSILFDFICVKLLMTDIGKKKKIKKKSALQKYGRRVIFRFLTNKPEVTVAQKNFLS